jgi:hypothetical protein
MWFVAGSVVIKPALVNSFIMFVTCSRVAPTKDLMSVFVSVIGMRVPLALPAGV